jgi:hypothetical protein
MVFAGLYFPLGYQQCISNNMSSLQLGILKVVLSWPNIQKKFFLNGEILEAEAARISVFDRGFLFGDGIYEVMARIGGRFFYE